MSEFKIHIFHTGEVCVAPDLPFGGEHCSTVRASGFLQKRSDRIWLPVSAYLIECEHGRILFDCGWHRNISPYGIEDKRAQIKSLGSFMLYMTNQGVIKKDEAIDEQLSALNIKPSDIDLVLLSHLDCDHANGLKLVRNAKDILVSEDEMHFAAKKTIVNKIRYNPKWWANTKIHTFNWNLSEGPAGKAYDVFGDGSLKMINIPGHSKGLCALKITASDGRFVLLYSDGGYAKKSWEQLITSGIADDKHAQRKSLEWIRKQCLDKNCVESAANHDPDITPHIIEL